MTQNNRSGGPVKSVDKALGLIEVLLEQRRPMSLQELSAACGCPKSTIHALLATLREHNMVEQRDDGRYYLGIRLFECGCAVSAQWDIARVAHPHLVQLADQTGGTAFIAILERGGSIILDQYVPTTGSGLQISQEPGRRHPLHATAQGKLVLSRMSDVDVLNRLNTPGMQSFTRHTITDPQRFLTELDKIRQYGYAVEDGEYKVGLRAIAAPVYDRSKQVKYALGVMGLFQRSVSDEFQQAIEHTVHQARQISLALGYRG